MNNQASKGASGVFPVKCSTDPAVTRRRVARRKPHTREAVGRIRAKLAAHWADPERRAQHGVLTKRRMARPGVSERISERTKAALADPEKRARHHAAVVATMASPVVRQRISERTREAMRDPMVRQRIRDGMARATRLRAELEPFRVVWKGLGAADASAAPPVRFSQQAVTSYYHAVTRSL